MFAVLSLKNTLKLNIQFQKWGYDILNYTVVFTILTIQIALMRTFTEML